MTYEFLKNKNKFLGLCTQDWIGPDWFVKGETYWCWKESLPGSYICIQTKRFDKNNLPIIATQKIENWEKHFVTLEEIIERRNARIDEILND